MTWIILGSVFLGVIIGKIGLLGSFTGNIDLITTVLLNILLFTVGLDLGANRGIWKKFLKLGWKIILVPLGTAVGSILGALFIGMFMDLELNNVVAVGVGFGWYTLSGVMLQKMVSVELGAIAFLANVFRELLAVVTVPLVAKKLGKMVSVAPGGATTMDTTLPIILKAAGSDMALIAFINGLILTCLVPILLPIIINI